MSLHAPEINAPVSIAYQRVSAQLTLSRILTLMGISDKLADLNTSCSQVWQRPFTPDNARPVILTFKGDVYTSLAEETFSEAQCNFAQRHLRCSQGCTVYCVR